MKKRITLALISLVLALILVAPVVVSAADQGKGPPDLERIVFIHSKFQDVKPGGNTSKNPALYSYSRYHWSSPTIPYYYNPSGSPVTNAEQGVTTSFATWNDTASSVYFDYKGITTAYVPGVDVALPDYKNVVGWAKLNDPDTIGLTIIWSNSKTKLVVDVDTVFNLDSWLTWSQTSVSGDPDTAPLLTNTSAYDCDVQGIMTHEAGHWLVLNDLYTNAAAAQTMYGYASDREVKKRSLESGDIAGVLKIYP
ncbi:hypothetical protein [Dehalogenimonas etheniformans]|uniref:Peptidase M10 metallopeptidase domain-containing protein n=1 Tax=Dehalogenimonas etheniformans TaxID=1536648 RepID=A0A2P5P6C3_9CHLR|nr:hypothetical protein [Dehalogenimonas etheniformans]PPD57861.1 hypothetical protein JP09_006050 [Dehalogenimonas etheniformans]QNT75486.1 hypothetical protein HX448_01680 [Dehalogenimonas etheniformans]